MSLLEEYADKFVILNQTDADDEYGSYKASYENGVEFTGSLAFTESHITSEIENLGLKSNYKLLTPKDLVLAFHQVIKRLSDGKVFRVTSDGSNVFTPPSSSLDLRLVTLEDWSLEDNADDGIDESEDL